MVYGDEVISWNNSRMLTIENTKMLLIIIIIKIIIIITRIFIHYNLSVLIKRTVINGLCNKRSIRNMCKNSKNRCILR